MFAQNAVLYARESVHSVTVSISIPISIAHVHMLLYLLEEIRDS
jgi:hypothetical protein